MIKNYKMNKLIYLSCFSALTILSACSDKNLDENVVLDSDKAEHTIDTSKTPVNEETKFKFDFAIANIPSPVSSINDLTNFGVPYSSNYLIDVKKPNGVNEFDKALLLGAYNIDMAYAMANDMGQDVLKFMKAIMMKSNELGLVSAVDQMIGKRAEKNISNKDSLFRILDEIFTKSDSYLRTNERVYTASSIFAGSWIESLYLNCRITNDVTNTEPYLKEKGYKQIWDQRFYLKNLSDLLNDYNNKKECTDLNNKIKEILAEITLIKDPKEFKESNFKSISEKIYSLRASILK